MKKQESQKGFTLVEIIISLAIFTIVALVAVGAFIKITSQNKKAITLKTSINNLNFALESMSREMRVGKTYRCGYDINPTSANCDFPSGTNPWVISFISSKSSITGLCNLKYEYRFIKNSNHGTIQKAEQSDCGVTISETDFHDLISPDIYITDSIVNVDNSNQPKIFLWLNGYSGVKLKERTEFSLQTTISQRLPK